MTPRLSLFHKMLITPVIASAFFLSFLFYTYSHLRESRTDTLAIQDSLFPVIRLANENLILLDAITKTFEDAVGAGEPAWLRRVSPAQQTIGDNLERFAALLAQDQQTTVERMRTALDAYVSAGMQLARRLLQSQPDPALTERLTAEMRQRQQRVRDSFSSFSEAQQQRLVHKVKSANAHNTEILTTGVLLGAVSIALMVYISLLVSLSIRRSIMALIGSMAELAEGTPDFSRRLTQRSDDELGELVRRFNRFTDKLEHDHEALMRAKQAAEQAMEELAETQRIACLGTWTFQVDSQQIHWSDEVFRIAGLEPRPEAPSFDEYLETVHPDDRARLLRHIEQSLAGQPYEVELRHRRPDGSYNYTLTRAKPVVAGGRVIQVQGTVLDLTQLRQAEQALRLSERQLRLVTDASPAAIAYLDSEHLSYLFVNRCFELTFGCAREDVIGRPMAETIEATSYRRTLPHLNAAREGREASFIDSLESSRGRRWINVTIVPDLDEQGAVRALVVMSHDITERKQEEVELSRAKSAAEAANRAKGEFLANMSHEIRTPLNAVIGFAELLERTALDDRQARYLASIKSGGKTLLSLIDDILDLSKIEAGKLSLQPEPVLPRPIFEDICSIFEPKARAKGIGLRLDYARDTPACLLLDETRVRQVLFNLVGNAIKFTHAGAVTIRVRHQTSASDPARLRLCVEVEDTGIGIPGDQQDKVFGSFDQQEGQSTRQYGGTGLGLSICRKLVQIMSGEIQLDSTPGRGSCFRVVLDPVEIAQAGASDRDAGMSQPAELDFEPARLLIVDDSASDRELLTEILADSGLELITAIDGAMAIALCQQQPPDLVLMDIRMPDMDGFETSRRLKALPSMGETPVVALTASVGLDSPRLESAQMDGYLTKPVRPLELSKALGRFLRRRRSVLAAGEALAEQALSSALYSEPARQALEQRLRPLWHRAVRTGLFEEALACARTLLEIATTHELQALAALAERIRQAVEDFDIEALETSLTELGALIPEEDTHG